MISKAPRVDSIDHPGTYYSEEHRVQLSLEEDRLPGLVPMHPTDGLTLGSE